MNLSNLKSFIKAPFQKNFSFFVVCFVIASVCDIMTRLYVYNLSFTILFIGIIYTMTYLLFLPMELIPQKIRVLYKIAVVVVASLNAIVDLVCLKIMDGAAFSEFLGVIAGTNMNEMIEFSKAFLSLDLLLYILAFALLVVLLVHFITKLTKYSSIVCNLSLLTIVSVFLLLSVSGKLFYFQDCYLGKYIKY